MTHVEHPNLAAALAAFQAELPKLRKDMTGKIDGESAKSGKFSYTYGYADLAQVTEEVSPVLGRHGLSFSSYPTMQGQTFVLYYELSHASGEVKAGSWPLPNPMTTDPKKVGSAITYARRYALMAVTNTFPDAEDDDGDAAGKAFSERQRAAQDFDNLPKERPSQQAKPAAQQRRTAAQPKAKDWSRATDEEIAAQRDKFREPTFTLDKAEALYRWLQERSIHEREVPDATLDGERTSAAQIFADRLWSEISGPIVTIERSQVKEVRRLADELGLANVVVTESETLGDMIDAAQTVLNADLETPSAMALRDAAEQSWSRADNAEPAEE